MIRHGQHQAGALDAEQIASILSLLAGAQKPVIIAGGGFKWSEGSQALVALAEAMQMPVVSSTGHHDVMATDNPLHAGQGGPRGNKVASGLTWDADVFLALGTRLGFNSTFHSNDYINAKASIVQVDVDGSALERTSPWQSGSLLRPERPHRC